MDESERLMRESDRYWLIACWCFAVSGVSAVMAVACAIVALAS